MSLRTALTAALLPLVRTHAPQCLDSLWGGESLTVQLTGLTVGPVAGRPEPGARWVSVGGPVLLRLLASTLARLPDEALWAAVASVPVPASAGLVRVHRLTLKTITETVDEGWCAQDLTFEVQADLAGAANPSAEG